MITIEAMESPEMKNRRFDNWMKTQKFVVYSEMTNQMKLNFYEALYRSWQAAIAAFGETK